MVLWPKVAAATGIVLCLGSGAHAQDLLPLDMDAAYCLGVLSEQKNSSAKLKRYFDARNPMPPSPDPAMAERTNEAIAAIERKYAHARDEKINSARAFLT